MCFLRDVIGSLDCKLVFWLTRTKPFSPFFKGGSGGVTICNVGGEGIIWDIHFTNRQTNQNFTLCSCFFRIMLLL